MCRIIISGNCKDISFYEFSNTLDKILGERPISLEEYLIGEDCVYLTLLEKYTKYYRARMKTFDSDIIQMYRMYKEASESPDGMNGVHICIVDTLNEESGHYISNITPEMPFSHVNMYLIWR